MTEAQPTGSPADDHVAPLEIVSIDSMFVTTPDGVVEVHADPDATDLMGITISSNGTFTMDFPREEQK
jgi:hypothetical protein